MCENKDNCDNCHSDIHSGEDLPFDEILANQKTIIAMLNRLILAVRLIPQINNNAIDTFFTPEYETIDEKEKPTGRL